MEKFKGFLSENDTYSACRGYWKKLLEDVIGKNKIKEWPEFQPRVYGDGKTKMPLDYLSIAEGWHKQSNRCFRIEQDEEKHWQGASPQIFSWTKYFPHHENDCPFPEEELVINLVLNDETEEIARKILRRWAHDFQPREQVQNYIDRITPTNI